MFNEDMLSSILKNFIESFPFIVYLVSAVAIGLIFYIGAENKDKLENNQVFFKQLGIMTIISVIIGYIVMINYDFLEKNLKILFIATTILGIILSLYVLKRYLFMANLFKNKNKLKVLANRVVMHPLTKNINKISIRDSLREKPRIMKEILSKDIISKIKDAQLIKEDVKRQIRNDLDLGHIIVNNIGVQIDFEVNKEKQLQTTITKKRIKAEKINSLNDLHISIIDAIKGSYSIKHMNKDLIAVDKKYKNLKFPISRYTLEMNLMKDYEQASLSYIIPITNLTLLAKDSYEEDFLGGLQCLTTTGIQSVGYSYYKLYEEFTKELTEKNKLKKFNLNKKNFQSKLDLNKKDIDSKSELENDKDEDI